MEINPAPNDLIHALDNEKGSSSTTENSSLHPASLRGKMQGVSIEDVPLSPRSINKGATTPDSLSSMSLEEHSISVNEGDTVSETSESNVDDDDVWKSVSSVAEEVEKTDAPAVSKELLDLARRFSEEKPVTGIMTLDVMKAHQEGAMPEFIKNFEQCRNNAAQAYRAGDQPMATRWAALAKDAQKSIHYSTQAFKTIMEDLANIATDPLITSYAFAARAMGERIESRIKILEEHREPTSLEERVDALQTQTIRAHEEAIQNFISNNIPDSKRWGSIGIRSRLAARLFGESAKCEQQVKEYKYKAQLAQQRGEFMISRIINEQSKQQLKQQKQNHSWADSMVQSITKLRLMVGKK